MLVDKLTIVIPTHNTHKVKTNTLMAPPSTRLLEKTIASLHKRVKGFWEIKKIVAFNYHNNYDERYHNNCSEFCAKKNIELYTNYSTGYKGVRCDLPSILNTPYLLLVEHDWEFLEDVDLHKIVEAMDNNENINYIRFNKRANVVFPKHMASGRLGGDLFMTEHYFDGLTLCASPNYSNNPHVERVSTLVDKFIPIVKNSTIYQGKNGGAGGFEHPLQEASYDYYKEHGEEAHTKEWGLYCYGGANFGPCIEHFGI